MSASHQRPDQGRNKQDRLKLLSSVKTFEDSSVKTFEESGREKLLLPEVSD